MLLMPDLSGIYKPSNTTVNIISKKVHKIKSYIVKKLCRFAYNLLIFFLTVNKSMGYNESVKQKDA